MSEVLESQINGIKERYSENLGFDIIDIEYFTLPFSKVAIECTCSINNLGLNIIEEFIIKILLKNKDYSINDKYIGELLGLDILFVNVYLDNLINNNYIDVNNEKLLRITQNGIDVYKNIDANNIGKVATLNSNYNIYLNSFLNEVLHDNNNYNKFKYIDLLKEHDIKLSTYDLYDMLLTNSIIKNSDEVIRINNIKYENMIYGVYASIWIYDISEGSLFCKVWDFSGKRFIDGELSKIIENKELEDRFEHIKRKLENEEKNKSMAAKIKAGEDGEARVSYQLKWLDDNKYITLNKKYILGKNEIQEFDHIVFGPMGIVHIETKNRSGGIKIDDRGNWYYKNKQSDNTYVLGANISEQVDRHQIVLNQIFEDEIEIDGCIAIANDNLKELIGIDNSNYAIMKYDNIRFYLNNMKSVFNNEFLQEASGFLNKFIIEFNDNNEAIEFRELQTLEGAKEVINKYFENTKIKGVKVNKEGLIEELRGLVNTNIADN